MTRLPAAALALGSGALWGLCFGPRPLLVAPWLALVPLFLLLDRERPGRWGFLHGLAAWLVSIPWILPTLETYGGLPKALAAVLLLLLCAYLALYHLAFAVLGRALWRRGGVASVLAPAAVWVGLEWLRSHLITGFPWNLAAYSVVETPGALQLSAWVGPYGISFLLLFFSGCLARAVVDRRLETAAWGAGLVVLALVAGGRWAAPTGHGSSAAGLPVHVIQPNIVASLQESNFQRDYRRLVRLSRRACERQRALLVWPESAAWPYTYEAAEFLRRDLAALATDGCPVLLNSTTRTEGPPFNSALMVDRRGVAGRYDKRHLVPFGEYVPAAVSWLPFVGKVARNAGDFGAGGEPSLLPASRDRLGVSICFEVIFPGEVAELIRAGATVLATITNDSWYGDSAAPWQHFRAARFRAAESHRPLIRAAITGVSGIIGPDGTVLSSLGVFEEGVLTTTVFGREELTTYSRLPWLVPLLCSLGAAFAIFRSARRRRSRRPTEP